MNAIVIDSITIRRDREGRFNLNDLHKAAGGEHRHRPNYFLKRPETKALASRINNLNAEISAIKSSPVATEAPSFVRS